VKPTSINKRKIFNDPVYGFIAVPYDIILDLIDHPWFQRLRRIKQLGMSHLVYPGALHTRFHHAMGAMFLMKEAVDVIRSKGHEISEEEAEAVTIAILLHDIGHGPFSHALEHSIAEGIHHEELSLLLMNKLNDEFKGKLTLAIKIFTNKYKKKFLHQLVSSQLDMDRLDYLKRDSFFTGVSEGVVSSDRILKMLSVHNDELVIEEKGIYSIEKFIVARRLMYWQVYLHKTVVASEFMLVNILKRAKFLASQKKKLFCSPAFERFLYHPIKSNDFKNPAVLNDFAALDDYDIMGAIKVWVNHEDKILSRLCSDLVNRRLFRISMSKSQAGSKEKEEIIKNIIKTTGCSKTDVGYFMVEDSLTNNAYNPKHDKINLIYKDGKTVDIAEASDNFNISALSKPVKKFVLGYLRY
jgi:HD superfamily phosphohydrolase